MSRPRRILTVCLGNHCRSPVAALVLAQRGKSRVQVRSAGLVDKWVDRPAHADMIMAAAQHGYDLRDHRGAQVNTAALGWADTVLAMDYAVLLRLRAQAAEEVAGKLGLYLAEQDVPDPFGQPYEAFTACVALIVAGADRHL